jgi:hypothetical protein
MYHYRLKSTGHSSATRYGNCEVCHKPAPEVFIQAEMRDYQRHDKTISQTYADCRPHTFGHEDCLRSIQRYTVSTTMPNRESEQCPRCGATNKKEQCCLYPPDRWHAPPRKPSVTSCNDCAIAWSCSLEADGPKFERCPKHR